MRYTNIQLLRVAAAGAVVFFHLGCHAPVLVGLDPWWFRYPWFGGFSVPLFFAVSGFVLTHARRSAPPSRFLVARFLRLYPGYWLALIGVLTLMRLRVYTEHHRWMVYFVNLNTVALWPVEWGRALYLLGIEWSLVYEVFLSVALAGMSLAGGRRGIAVLTGLWLAATLAKVALWPGYAFDTFPHWSRIAISAYNVPFMLGVLVYHVRGVGSRWRWVVLAAVLADLAVVPFLGLTAEQHWCNWGLAAAGVVWLAVQFPQVSERNPLARAGDWTYGLYLVHVPLMFAVFYPAARFGWVGRWEVVWLAGAVTLVGGLLFGRVECAVHARLRPLAKLDLRAWRTWPVARLLARPAVRT